MSGRAILRSSRIAALALAAAAALGAEAAEAASKKCGLVCVYSEPDFKGRRVCYRHPIRTPDLERAWGAGFVPSSVKVTRHGRCSPIAYFFTGTGYRGVVAAYFGTAANISGRRFRSFRLRHFELDD